MRLNLLTIAFLVLATSGFGLVGCKKEKGAATIDPHSPEGVMLKLKEQTQLFNEAIGKKDFKYVHDFTYYFTGLAQALYAKLDDGQKKSLRGSFDELYSLATQLDHASGRHHAEATEASMQRIQSVLEQLEREIGEKKNGN